MVNALPHSAVTRLGAVCCSIAIVVGQVLVTDGVTEAYSCTLISVTVLEGMIERALRGPTCQLRQEATLSRHGWAEEARILRLGSVDNPLLLIAFNISLLGLSLPWA